MWGCEGWWCENVGEVDELTRLISSLTTIICSLSRLASCLTDSTSRSTLRTYWSCDNGHVCTAHVTMDTLLWNGTEEGCWASACLYLRPPCWVPGWTAVASWPAWMHAPVWSTIIIYIQEKARAKYTIFTEAWSSQGDLHLQMSACPCVYWELHLPTPWPQNSRQKNGSNPSLHSGQQQVKGRAKQMLQSLKDTHVAMEADGESRHLHFVAPGDVITTDTDFMRCGWWYYV